MINRPTHRNPRFLRIIGVILLLSLLVVVQPGTAKCSNFWRHVVARVLFHFESADFVEGVAVDRRGNTYVSLAAKGEIHRVGRHGQLRLFAQLPPPVQGLGLLGLATDWRGNVFAANWSGDPDNHGVWKFSRNGDGDRIPGTESIFGPDDIAVGYFGDLFVTDALLGAIWRIDRHGNVELWFQDPLLQGTGEFLGFPIGANGIEVSWGEVLVSVTEAGRVVSIPISHDGSAGSPYVLAEAPELLTVDGLAVDRNGDVYVPVILTNSIIKIDRFSGQTETIAGPNEFMDQPVGLAFKRNGRLLVTNSAAFPDDNPDRNGASLVELKLNQ